MTWAHDEETTLVTWAVAFWWVLDGPGSASWRAGFGLCQTDSFDLKLLPVNLR
jgi:hypothetical protein